MIIRCDRCSTVYELDEGLLAPEGSPVQCSRCANVFTARPARVPGQTLQGVPPPVEPSPPAAAPAPPPEPTRPAGVRPTPVRSTPAVYKPSSPSSPARAPVTRAPVLRRDTVGTFESRLRRNARWRWLAPAAVAALAAAAGGAWLALRRPPEPTGRVARADALALAARDDADSLQRAAAMLDGVVRSAAQPAAAEADRVLVELLLADGGTARGAGEAGGAVAREALSRAAGGAQAPGEVARARAVAAALDGNREEVKRQATAARAKLAGDAWAGLAEVWVEVRSSDRVARERGLTALGVFAERHPELLRARYLFAQALAASGRHGEAVAAVEQVLVRNPAHGRAASLKAELERPPPQAPVTKPAPPVAPPPPTPVAAEPPAPPGGAARASNLLPRKPVHQPDAAEGSAQAAPALREGSSPAPRRNGEPLAPAAGADGGVVPATPEGGAEDPGAAPRPSRLRPAAVPQPEPVLSGE